MKMKLLYIIKLCMILVIVSSCKGPSNSKRISTSSDKPEIADEITAVKNAVSDSSTEIIDFFGVRLYGKYNELIYQLYDLPILSLVEDRNTLRLEREDIWYFSHTVEFCGVPCGMNVRYRINLEDEISIHDLRFITSQTDNEIIHRFVSELTKYYGVPDISDDKEDSYHWYLPSGMAVRARHLHAPDGGWTVYFYY